MLAVKRGYTLKEISEETGIKYSTLSERVRRSVVVPVYVICESRGPGTGKGNLYDIDEVLALFRPEKRGRPRKLHV
jgi:hypothetical protein